MKFPLSGYLLIIIVLNMASNTPAPAQDIKSLFSLPMEQLINVEITSAGKKPEKVAETPASVVLITRNEIEQYGYQTLHEILEHVPGLYKIDDYFWIGGYNYGVRGFYSTGVFNDIIILIDGVNQKEDYYDSYNLSKINIPVEAIDRIEIVRGPMSVIYGNGAFFGAINIITKNGQASSAHRNMASATAGTAGKKKLHLRLSEEGEDFSITANGALSRDNGQGRPLAGMAPYPYPEFWGITNKETAVQRMCESQYYTVLAQYRHISLSITHTSNTQTVVDGSPVPGSGDLSRIGATAVSLGFKKRLNNNWTVRARASSFFTTQDNEYNSYSEYAPDISNTYGYASQQSKSWETECNLFYTTERLKLATGGFIHGTNHLQARIDIPLLNYDNILYGLPPGMGIITQSLWSQGTLQVTPVLNMVAGFRIEKLDSYTLSITDFSNLSAPSYEEFAYKSNKASIIPRVAVIYNPGKESAVKLMYGKAVKQPSYGQNNEICKMRHFDNIDAPQLAPAEITTAELNVLAAINPCLQASASVYYNKLEKLISRFNYTQDGQYAWKIGNAGKMTTTGIELGIQARPLPFWQIQANFVMQKTINRQAGFPHIRPGYAPAVLGYIKTIVNPVRNMHIAVTGRYAGAMETAWDPVENSRIGESVPSRFIFDANLRLSPRFLYGGFIACHVANIMDTEIRYPATGNSAWAPMGTLGPSRRVFISAGYTW